MTNHTPVNMQKKTCRLATNTNFLIFYHYKATLHVSALHRHTESCLPSWIKLLRQYIIIKTITIIHIVLFYHKVETSEAVTAHIRSYY